MGYGGAQEQDKHKVKGFKDNETICAVSTPPGFGGIAVIRISGPQSFEISRKIVHFLPEEPETHKIYFGTLNSFIEKTAIDEVLVSTFHQGKSYSGEETVEISCHGSPAITQWILQELVSAGARIADRGEFSYRAFINGKIDLVQAEGVLELVESQSKRAIQQGLRQLKGGLSLKLKNIQSDLLYVLANIEAAIDFSTEDIEVLNKETLFARTKRAEETLGILLSTYEHGRLLIEGLQVVLFGAPNVGKSSLFNLLLEEARSIVTEIPGTTRDVVESILLLDGVRVAFFDTAGIRESGDSVEKIGVQKSRESQSKADVIFFLFDGSRLFSSADVEILRGLDLKKVLILGNKIDLFLESEDQRRNKLKAVLKKSDLFLNQNELDLFVQKKVLFISTKENKSREIVLNSLREHLTNNQLEDEAVISQARHFENLSRAADFIKQGNEAISHGADAEFVALDFKAALICIQETLGERFDDQIMDFVFKQFCIGK